MGLFPAAGCGAAKEALTSPAFRFRFGFLNRCLEAGASHIGLFPLCEGRIAFVFAIVCEDRQMQICCDVNDEQPFRHWSKPMPLTKKGSKIKRAMARQYGARKGTAVFYASANKGTIRGVHRARRGK
jgi:hypothetical protein